MTRSISSNALYSSTNPLSFPYPPLHLTRTRFINQVSTKSQETAPFSSLYFPLPVALLSVGKNIIWNCSTSPREFIPFVMNVVAVHGSVKPQEREAILYLSLEDFATLGER